MSLQNIPDNAVETELHRYSSIVEKHAQELNTIKETLEQYAIPPWHPKEDMICLQLKPFEFVSDFDLISKSTDNHLLNKTVFALTALCKEMISLTNEAEKDFYIPLCIYGDPGNSENVITQFTDLGFSQMLPILDRINSYVEYVKKLVLNVSLQLSALHSNQKNSFSVHAGAAHFQVVFEHLGKVLGTLVVLDELISDNAVLQEHFVLYKKLLKSSVADPSAFDSTRTEFENLKNFLNDLEKKVLTASIYKDVLAEVGRNSSSTVSKNSCLREEVSTVIQGWSSQIEDASSDSWLYEYKDQVLAITALAIFHQVIFDVQDKKIAKELITLYKKIPCVTVAVNHVWIGEKYIECHFQSLYSLFERKSLDSLMMHRKNYLANKMQSMANEVQTLSLKILGWSVQMESTAKKSANLMTKQDLDHRAFLLWQGLLWASNLKFTAESVLGLHSVIGHPMGRSCVTTFCRLVELLKTIEYTYHYNTSMLSETLPHLRQYLSYQLLNLLKTTRTRAKNVRKLSQHILDVLSALSLSEQMLSGNGNRNRLLVARVALSLANQDKIISDEELSLLLVYLRQLSIASDIQEKVQRITDTGFLFQHQIIFKLYLQDFMDNNSTPVHRLHYMLAAVGDSENLLKAPKDLPNREELLKCLHEETEELLKRELLDKLCKAVETELRLKSHSHLQVNKKDPFENPLKQIYPLIHLQPLNLFESCIRVKNYVEQYLEKTFYNLTVVAPHDCNTYDLMRNEAFSSLGLVTVDSHLPSHTIEQGVDVLEIMRNINVFVQHYKYNLNQQFFIEIDSNNKHLSTVSIKHIANSIRTHGTGIINTTVNFTYQFLRKKFHIFSQFLYDEHIKSRLLKDLQYWKQVKQNDKSFPYERANKFHRGIRKLGVTSDGLSYLDRFRNLITHIGNAIGYVRLVRSGCLHCISAATEFIPDLQEVVVFEELIHEDVLDECTIQAAKNLDLVLHNLTSHFLTETDYLKIMVDVFSEVLQDPKNSHLKNFFLIVPALSINFIEYFTGAKENLLKKKRKGSAFTDDGFSVGVAYILRVLNQTEAFDSLHWWSGVRRKFISEKEKAESESGKASEGDAKLQQTLSLTLRRLKEHQTAFELLYLGVSSAQVFFKESKNEEKDNQSVTKEDLPS